MILNRQIKTRKTRTNGVKRFKLGASSTYVFLKKSKVKKQSKIGLKALLQK